MRRFFVALAIVAGGCLETPHDPGAGAIAVAAEDCFTCHEPEYEATTDPPHVGDWPTTCSDCHATTAWTPALEGGEHPDSAFPIQAGAHGDIACTDCHVPGAGPSVGGLNVSCIGCHTHARSVVDEQHHEEPRYEYDDTRPAFCRDCHPRGRT